MKDDHETKHMVMNTIHDAALKVLKEDHYGKKCKDEAKLKVLETDIKEMETNHAEEVVSIAAFRRKQKIELLRM